MARKLIVNLHWSHSRRSSCVENVARLQREELRNIGYQLIHLVEHVGSASLLHSVAIDVEMEMNGLHIAELLHRNPLADGSRTVETLAQLPWLAFGTQLLLKLACGKVDAYSHCIIVAMGETLRNGFAKTRYAHHKFSLIVYTPEVVGDEERLMVLEKSRIGLSEYHGTFWFI